MRAGWLSFLRMQRKAGVARIFLWGICTSSYPQECSFYLSDWEGGVERGHDMFCRQQSQSALGVITFCLSGCLLLDQPWKEARPTSTGSAMLWWALQVDQAQSRQQRDSGTQPDPHVLGMMASPRWWETCRGSSCWPLCASHRPGLGSV